MILLYGERNFTVYIYLITELKGNNYYEISTAFFNDQDT